LRNIFFFKKILSRIEIKAILNSAPYNTAYHWLSQSEHNIINNINLSSSIGAVYSVNNQNLNFIKTVIKTNG
jgi:pantothenate kinase-related protein Tda10